MIMLTLSIFSVSALTLETNQDTNNNDYYAKTNGNIIIKNLVGSYSTTNNQSFGVGGINGTLYYYDLDYEFTSTNEDFYLMIQNTAVNQTATIMYRGDLTRDSTLYIQNVTFNEVGRYLFKFIPSYENEPARIYLEVPDAFVGTIEYAEQKPEGFTSIVGGLITTSEELIDINISLWRIAFYSIVTGLIIAFVLGIFGIAFMMFRYSKKLSEDRQHK